MPCTYTGSLDGDRIMNLEQSREELKKELDVLTEMLCSQCRHLEERQPDNYAFLMTPAVKDWWRVHKRLDLERTLVEIDKSNLPDEIKKEMGRLLRERYGEV